MKAEKVVNHILTYCALVVLCMSTSCASLSGRAYEGFGNQPKSSVPISDRIYPGLHMFPKEFHEAEGGVERVGLVIDIPFSFAFDTLVLPFDILGIPVFYF